MKSADTTESPETVLDRALLLTELISSTVEDQAREIRKLRDEKRELTGLLRLALDMVKLGSKGLN